MSQHRWPSRIRSVRDGLRLQGHQSLSLRALAAVALLGTAVAVVLGNWAGAWGSLGGSLLVLGSRVYAANVAAAWMRQATHPAIARPRRFLTAALFLWVVADAGDIVVAALTGTTPGAQSPENLLRAAGYLAALAAFASYRPLSAGRFGRYRDAIEFAVLTSGIMSLTWLVVVQPVVTVGIADQIGAGWHAYPLAMDALLLVLLLRLTLLQLSPYSFGLTMMLAFLLHGFGDAVAGYRVLAEQAGANGPVWVGWMLASLLMATAISMDIRSRQGPIPPRAKTRSIWMRRLESLLPIVLTYAVVGYTIADWWLTRQVEWAGVATGGIMVILLVARQGLIAGQTELQQYVALVSASADLAFIAESDGRILLENPAMTGATKQGTGAAAMASLPEILDEGEESGPILRAAVDEGWSGEVNFLRQDGSRFPVALSLRPVRDERRSRPLLVGTAHDMTVTKQREIELRHALEEVRKARVELEQLNRALEGKVEARTRDLAAMVEDLARLNEDLKALDRMKTEFVALVSHELRAPLTNIRTGIELILSSGEGPQEPISQSLKLVGEETDRLNRFVEAILDLSSLEAGKYPIQMMPISLAELTAAVVARLPEAGPRERIRVEIPAGLPPVMADERALGSVVFHLVENAIKYAPKGDVVLNAQEGDGRIVVRVTDHGPGIPEEERENVFEMFHRLDARDAREIYGHGLGLFTARRMVEAMGGRIWVEAVPGGGACFAVSLEARPEGIAP